MHKHIYIYIERERYCHAAGSGGNVGGTLAVHRLRRTAVASILGIRSSCSLKYTANTDTTTTNNNNNNNNNNKV